MKILAHRGNTDGPDAAGENTRGQCARAFSLGLGVEIDLRRDGRGSCYVSHDPAAATGHNELCCFTPLFRRYCWLPIAVNIKQLGFEREQVRFQLDGHFGNRSFYFDYELLEPETPGRSQSKIRDLPGGEAVTLAARISDRGETIEQCLSIPAEIVWADEFDSFWITPDHLKPLRQAGRQIFVVSPELHGFSQAGRLRRWADFKSWGVDGICTDYGLQAQSFFSD